MRTILGKGSVGQIVIDIQTKLNANGFNTKGVDSVYGGDTATAVSGFQKAQGVAATGTVDDGTWSSLMGVPAPTVANRALQLTAGFEGQGFGLAVGNFDGALLTWGIIGFTMGAGEVQEIVLGVNATNPDVVENAFGSDAAALVSIMQDTHANELAWANSITLPSGSLAQPWRDEFAAFGADPVVQAKQLALVGSEYMQPAIALAKSYGLTSECGLALCFDIKVQDGGINATVAAQIAAQRTHAPTEAALLTIMAQAVAAASNPKWSADVLSRKLAIATGSGVVHGRHYVLDNWGLNVGFAAAELS